MALSITLAAQEVVSAAEWKDLHVHEGLGEVDTFTANILAFVRGDPAMTEMAVTLLLEYDNFLQCIVRRDDDPVPWFSGLARVRNGTKKALGAISWNVQAVGWEFLAPLRKVGVPDGSIYIIQEDDDEDRIPTAVAIDPSASANPTPGSIEALWNWYWNFPVIDLETFVFDILPVGASVEDLEFSGTDLDGAMNEIIAAGNAAGRWWIANDSPDPQTTTAPNLALHVAAIALPDEGDDGDDLLAGFPSADAPILVAPFEIDNDNPDGVDSIMAMETSFGVDLSEKRDAAYVRGATGYSYTLQETAPGSPLPFTISAAPIPGGSGWVSSPGGVWGEDYVDAPAAISSDQRDAIGQAFLASRQGARVAGTVKVGNWEGVAPHKGQAIRVTDADWGFAGRWFLISGVDITEPEPMALVPEYVLQVGDTLSPSIGFELRQQRLREEREELDPVTKFVMYVGDLLLAPGGTAPITGQAANDAGKAKPVKGIRVQWYLMVNGLPLADVEDTGEAFYLSDLVEETDEAGQITATLHAGAGATLADAAAPFAKIIA